LTSSSSKIQDYSDDDSDDLEDESDSRKRQPRHQQPKKEILQKTEPPPNFPVNVHLPGHAHAQSLQSGVQLPVQSPEKSGPLSVQSEQQLDIKIRVEEFKTEEEQEEKISVKVKNVGFTSRHIMVIRKRLREFGVFPTHIEFPAENSDNSYFVMLFASAEDIEALNDLVGKHLSQHWIFQYFKSNNSTDSSTNNSTNKIKNN